MHTVPVLRLAILFLSLIGTVRCSSNQVDSGDSSCHCLTLERVQEFSAANHTTYGIGCDAHDETLPPCNDPNACENQQNIIPAPFCDNSWCTRQWCYVDPNECSLLNRRSSVSPELFYSYATCGDADSFSLNNRFKALRNRVLKAGFNSNSGGWLGAYSNNGTQFQGPFSRWSGPVVDFVQQSALRGGFQIELTEPPRDLRSKAQDFFQSSSNFDYCVYATSLGYVDMCVAQYTVTDARASTTDFLLLGSSGIYLVASEKQGGSWDQFFESLSTIFQPFTFGTWLFVVFFVIPIMGCLMVYHERGLSGSAYPKEESVVIHKEDGSMQLRKVKIPFGVHIVKSIYINLLAVLQSSYEQTVISIGGMLNLLGISFFILTLIAVYTANLAAILTTEKAQTSVQSLDDAIRANLRICSERKNMETVTRVFGVPPDLFVTDPVELGGDGQPGFNCAGCNNRRRVFEFMDPTLADTDPRYCHVALAPEEDLEVFHTKAEFCSKVTVGAPVTFVQTGIPIFEGISPELTSFFLHMKNEGVFARIAEISRPVSTCPAKEGQEGEALTITQLTGIWVVSFGFAIAGLIATAFQPFLQKRFCGTKPGQVEKLQHRE